jgi:hypothetical protein
MEEVFRLREREGELFSKQVSDLKSHLTQKDDLLVPNIISITLSFFVINAPLKILFFQ